jgi:hypothetical protein
MRPMVGCCQPNSAYDRSFTFLELYLDWLPPHVEHGRPTPTPTQRSVDWIGVPYISPRHCVVVWRNHSPVNYEPGVHQEPND